MLLYLVNLKFFHLFFPFKKNHGSFVRRVETDFATVWEISIKCNNKSDTAIKIQLAAQS